MIMINKPKKWLLGFDVSHFNIVASRDPVFDNSPPMLDFLNTFFHQRRTTAARRSPINSLVVSDVSYFPMGFARIKKRYLPCQQDSLGCTYDGIITRENLLNCLLQYWNIMIHMYIFCRRYRWANSIIILYFDVNKSWRCDYTKKSELQPNHNRLSLQLYPARYNQAGSISTKERKYSRNIWQTNM